MNVNEFLEMAVDCGMCHVPVYFTRPEQVPPACRIYIYIGPRFSLLFLINIFRLFIAFLFTCAQCIRCTNKYVALSNLPMSLNNFLRSQNARSRPRKPIL